MGMRVIGITGGIGMGKSTAAEILRSLGVRVVDTDDIARAEVSPGSAGLAEVVAHFGSEILDEAGELRRSDLGERVFRTPTDRIALERILHPRIQRRWQSQLVDWRAAGVSLACVVIPLLFEKNYREEFEAVVAVACGEATQHARTSARGWTGDQLRLREQAQLPVARKIAEADFLVWTEGTMAVHRRQWLRILEDIRQPGTFTAV